MLYSTALSNVITALKDLHEAAQEAGHPTHNFLTGEGFKIPTLELVEDAENLLPVVVRQEQENR